MYVLDAGSGAGRRTHQRSRHDNLVIGQLRHVPEDYLAGLQHLLQNRFAPFGKATASATQEPAAQQDLFTYGFCQFHPCRHLFFPQISLQ